MENKVNIIPEIRVREVNTEYKNKDTMCKDLRDRSSMCRDLREKNSMCRDLTDKNNTDRHIREKNSIDRDLGDFRDLKDKVSSSVKKKKEGFWVLKAANVVGEAPKGADLFMLLLEPLWKLFQATGPRIRIEITIETIITRTIMIAMARGSVEVRCWEYGRMIDQIVLGIMKRP